MSWWISLARCWGKIWLRWCCCCFCFGLIPTLTAASPEVTLPAPFSASYHLDYGGLRIVELQARFSQVAEESGIQYLLRVNAATVGPTQLFFPTELRVRSQALLQAGDLRPLSIDYLRQGYKGEEVHMKFDWEQGVLERRTPSAVPQMRELDSSDLSDVMVYWVRLMTDLRGPASTFNYSVINTRGELKRYVFTKENEEPLKTALGTVHTVRLLREAVGENGKKNSNSLRIWCARDLDFLPVRIEYLKSGKLRGRALVQEHNYLGKAPREDAPPHLSRSLPLGGSLHR